MASANTADAWRQGGAPDRAFAAPRGPRRDRVHTDRTSRPMRGDVPSRRSEGFRGAEAAHRGHAAEFSRGSARSSVDRGRPADRDRRGEDRHGGRSAGRPSAAAASRGRAALAEERGGRLRGIVAVLGMFLVTLAGGGVDSLTGIGLGMITLVALVGTTVLATLLVRRRDLLTVVVAPPLVFIAVAAANIGFAPSASFSLPTIATLLIRGFPAMGLATGAALVLSLIRLAARR